MNLSDHYDVICAGGGVSSYLCSALLSKAGKKVLLIDDEDLAMPRVCDGGHIFDPDHILLSGCEPTSALGQSLSALGILPNSQYRPLASVTQVLTPRYRI